MNAFPVSCRRLHPSVKHYEQPGGPSYIRRDLRLTQIAAVIAAVVDAGGAKARKVGIHPDGNRKQRRGFHAVEAKLR